MHIQPKRGIYMSEPRKEFKDVKDTKQEIKETKQVSNNQTESDLLPGFPKGVLQPVLFSVLELGDAAELASIHNLALYPDTKEQKTLKIF